MTLRAEFLNKGKLFRRAGAFILRAGLAAFAVLLVSLVVILSSAVAGPYSIDVTFDLLPTSLQFGEVEWNAADDDQNTRCTDETLALNDGVSWVRCRFIADEINDAKQYLHRQGMQTGEVYRDIRITPVRDGYGFYLASVVIAAGLAMLLIRVFRWSLSAELKVIKNMGWGAFVVLVAPTVIFMSLASLFFWAVGVEARHSAVQSFSPSEQISLMVAAILIAPLLEELLYRGLVYSLLQRASGAIPACMVGTGLFVIAHGSMEFWDSGIPRLLMIGFLSVSLYAVRVRFSSLILCIGAHAFFNAVVVFAWLSAAG